MDGGIAGAGGAKACTDERPTMETLVCANAVEPAKAATTANPIKFVLLLILSPQLSGHSILTWTVFQLPFFDYFPV